MNFIDDEEFHMQVFHNLIKNGLFDFFEYIKSDHFLKIRELIEIDPRNILIQG